MTKKSVSEMMRAFLFPPDDSTCFDDRKVCTVTPNCCPFLLDSWRHTCTIRQENYYLVLSYHLIPN